MILMLSTRHSRDEPHTKHAAAASANAHVPCVSLPMTFAARLPLLTWITRRFIDTNLNRLFLPEEERRGSSCSSTVEEARVPELTAAIAQSTAHVDLHSSRWAPADFLNALLNMLSQPAELVGGWARGSLCTYKFIPSSQVVEA